MSVNLTLSASVLEASQSLRSLTGTPQKSINTFVVAMAVVTVAIVVHHCCSCGIGGVKRRKVLCMPPRDASCRRRVCDNRGHVDVKGVRPRVSAARSGEAEGWVVGNGWKRSRMLQRGAKLCIDGRRGRECVGFESLRPHASATHWGMQGSEYTEL
ncbi:hypothetical protein EDB85DRAFT_1894479 [Lactarius pseudohatsudake]|nr:hypothetical protein EDB85DRAFT_1894479 [Lactarius pseudohatsudake]